MQNNKYTLPVVEQETGSRKISKKKIALYILLVIVLTAAAVQFLNASKYDALVQVKDTDTVGVNPTGDRLDFGDLPRNRDAIRIVNLANQSPYKVSSLVVVWKYGDIADLMKLNKNNFVLEPGESERLEFTVHVPSSADYKYYRGKVVIFQIPKLW